MDVEKLVDNLLKVRLYKTGNKLSYRKITRV